jgi:hypothetical protein
MTVWTVLCVRQLLSVDPKAMVGVAPGVTSAANVSVFKTQEEAVKHADRIRQSSRTWNVLVKELPVHEKSERVPLPAASKITEN